MFCPNCGHDAGESNFCPSCGNTLKEAEIKPAQAGSPLDEETILWEGKPSNIADKAKGAFNTVRYIITNQRVIKRYGLIGKKEEEIDLRTVKDYKVRQSVAERVQGVGDLIIHSVDPDSPEFELSNIPKAADVKEILRKAVIDYKRHLGVVMEEKL